MVKFSRFLQIFCGCHCRPDRSFFYKGKQFPVCARCTGMLIGYPLGILWLVFFTHWNIGICLFVCLPLIIDGIGQQLGKWESTNIRRFITGLLLGMAIINVLVNYHYFLVWEARKVLEFFQSR